MVANMQPRSRRHGDRIFFQIYRRRRGDSRRQLVVSFRNQRSAMLYFLMCQRFGRSEYVCGVYEGRYASPGRRIASLYQPIWFRRCRHADDIVIGDVEPRDISI
jgi:hypothetical protein